MSKKHKTELIERASQEAVQIIRQGSDDPQGTAEKLEDLIDCLAQAEDRIRETAREANLAIRPRRQVNFPDPRSVMQAVREAVYEEAHETLGTRMDEHPAEQPLDAATGLEELVSEKTWLGRYDESNAARLAVATLESINRNITQDSLNELAPAERKTLIEAAMAEITKE